MMPKVWIESYGCSASMADSEMIAGQLKNNGYEIARDVNSADVNLIVTCAVKDKTANRMVYRIRDLTRTGRPLIVAGCLAKAEPESVAKTSPRASLLGPDAIDRTIEVVNSALSGLRSIVLEGTGRPKVNLPRLRLNPAVSIVEIASGCLSDCTFCETRLAKGRLRSYRIGDIVRQVRLDVAEGCREVWLTSTDNGPYGRDIGCNLADLINAVCDVGDDFMVRVGMMNPAYLPSMLEDLIEAYHNEKVFKFMHVPVQSGSDRILRLMRRGHRASLLADIVKRFRNEFGEFTIATDVIVGFPTESEADFQATLDLMREVEPDIINISRYSARPGTEASRMEKTGVKIVKERSGTLHRLANTLSYRRNKRWISWRGEVVVDEIKKKNGNPIGLQGRNYAYKPVFLRGRTELGSKVKTRVTSATNHSLVGVVEL